MDVLPDTDRDVRTPAVTLTTGDRPVTEPRWARVRPYFADRIASVVVVQGLAVAMLIAGTSVGEVFRTAIAVALTADVVSMQRPPRSWFDHVVLLVFGLAGVIAGVGIGVQHLTVSPSAWQGVVGVVAVGTGLAVAAVAVRRLLRPLRRWRKLVVVPIGLVVLVGVVMPVTLAVFVSATPYFPLGDDTPADHGLAYEDVSLTTEDGIDLAAWYVPSTNRAAIVLLGGCCGARDDQLQLASVLAGRGFGVLMLDQRGHGGSDGHAMLWGWWGELDVRAGVDHLMTRADVDRDRIGAIGMSVGGEQVVAAAGVDHRIRAVVAEGVTARGARDEGDPATGVGGLLTRYTDWVTRNAAAVLTSADTPTQMRSAVSTMTDEQHVLLVVAGTLPAEIAAAEALDDAAPGVVDMWVAPDAAHIGARELHPQEWEARVTTFFRAELGVDGRSSS